MKHESGMREHPLTPMTDPNLVRVLQTQTRRKVGLIDHGVVARGPDAIVQRIAKLHAEGVSMAIVDCTTNAQLMNMGSALKEMPLLTAGSGIALGLPANAGLRPGNAAASLPAARGTRAIVSGRCSEATNRQVQDFIEAGGAAWALDPLALLTGRDVVADATEWARSRLSEGPVLVYATAPAESVRAVQSQCGREGLHIALKSGNFGSPAMFTEAFELLASNDD
jgi:uncharacterized protein YgbK (DUF1537 family)